MPAESPPPPEAAAGGEAWVGARRRAMLPSGEYFRGRPRFFLAREQAFIGEEEPSYAEAGNGSDEGGGWCCCGTAAKGNCAVAGASMAETVAEELGPMLAEP